jgi:hypothetical protein
LLLLLTEPGEQAMRLELQRLSSIQQAPSSSRMP